MKRIVDYHNNCTIIQEVFLNCVIEKCMNGKVLHRINTIVKDAKNTTVYNNTIDVVTGYLKSNVTSEIDIARGFIDKKPAVSEEEAILFDLGFIK